jgi:alkylated DNA repair dioxygenase AlkB
MLDLFTKNDSKTNLLPFDGEVYYYGEIFDFKQSQDYFDILLKTINWENDVVKIFGKTHITKRKMAWYSLENKEYTYSNSTKTANKFTKELSEIKLKIEELTNEKYNSCLLNLYHNGEEGMGWHADNEPEIEKYSAIASISFGVERAFSFKNKQTKETIKLNLENGSLLVMKGLTQENWLHSLPKSVKANSARINLTFRKMKG